MNKDIMSHPSDTRFQRTAIDSDTLILYNSTNTFHQRVIVKAKRTPIIDIDRTYAQQSKVRVTIKPIKPVVDTGSYRPISEAPTVSNHTKHRHIVRKTAQIVSIPTLNDRNIKSQPHESLLKTTNTPRSYGVTTKENVPTYRAVQKRTHKTKIPTTALPEDTSPPTEQQISKLARLLESRQKPVVSVRPYGVTKNTPALEQTSVDPFLPIDNVTPAVIKPRRLPIPRPNTQAVPVSVSPQKKPRKTEEEIKQLQEYMKKKKQEEKAKLKADEETKKQLAEKKNRELSKLSLERLRQRAEVQARKARQEEKLQLEKLKETREVYPQSESSGIVAEQSPMEDTKVESHGDDNTKEAQGDELIDINPLAESHSLIQPVQTETASVPNSISKAEEPPTSDHQQHEEVHPAINQTKSRLAYLSTLVHEVLQVQDVLERAMREKAIEKKESATKACQTECENAFDTETGALHPEKSVSNAVQNKADEDEIGIMNLYQFTSSPQKKSQETNAATTIQRFVRSYLKEKLEKQPTLVEMVSETKSDDAVEQISTPKSQPLVLSTLEQRISDSYEKPIILQPVSTSILDTVSIEPDSLSFMNIVSKRLSKPISLRPVENEVFVPLDSTPSRAVPVSPSQEIDEKAFVREVQAPKLDSPTPPISFARSADDVHDESFQVTEVLNIMSDTEQSDFSEQADENVSMFTSKEEVNTSMVHEGLSNVDTKKSIATGNVMEILVSPPPPQERSRSFLLKESPPVFPQVTAEPSVSTSFLPSHIHSGRISPRSLGRTFDAELQLLEVIQDSHIQQSELDKNRQVALAQHENIALVQLLLDKKNHHDRELQEAKMHSEILQRELEIAKSNTPIKTIIEETEDSEIEAMPSVAIHNNFIDDSLKRPQQRFVPEEPSTVPTPPVPKLNAWEHQIENALISSMEKEKENIEQLRHRSSVVSANRRPSEKIGKEEIASSDEISADSESSLLDLNRFVLEAKKVLRKEGQLRKKQHKLETSKQLTESVIRKKKDLEDWEARLEEEESRVANIMTTIFRGPLPVIKSTPSFSSTTKQIRGMSTTIPFETSRKHSMIGLPDYEPSFDGGDDMSDRFSLSERDEASKTQSSIGESIIQEIDDIAGSIEEDIAESIENATSDSIEEKLSVEERDSNNDAPNYSDDFEESVESLLGKRSHDHKIDSNNALVSASDENAISTLLASRFGNADSNISLIQDPDDSFSEAAKEMLELEQRVNQMMATLKEKQKAFQAVRISELKRKEAIIATKLAAMEENLKTAMIPKSAFEEPEISLLKDDVSDILARPKKQLTTKDPTPVAKIRELESESPVVDVKAAFEEPEISLLKDDVSDILARHKKQLSTKDPTPVAKIRELESESPVVDVKATIKQAVIFQQAKDSPLNIPVKESVLLVAPERPNVVQVDTQSTQEAPFKATGESAMDMPAVQIITPKEAETINLEQEEAPEEEIEIIIEDEDSLELDLPDQPSKEPIFVSNDVIEPIPSAPPATPLSLQIKMKSLDSVHSSLETVSPSHIERPFDWDDESVEADDTDRIEKEELTYHIKNEVLVNSLDVDNTASMIFEHLLIDTALVCRSAMIKSTRICAEPESIPFSPVSEKEVFLSARNSDKDLPVSSSNPEKLDALPEAEIKTVLFVSESKVLKSDTVADTQMNTQMKNDSPLSFSDVIEKTLDTLLNQPKYTSPPEVDYVVFKRMEFISSDSTPEETVMLAFETIQEAFEEAFMIPNSLLRLPPKYTREQLKAKMLDIISKWEVYPTVHGEDLDALLISDVKKSEKKWESTMEKHDKLMIDQLVEDMWNSLLDDAAEACQRV